MKTNIISIIMEDGSSNIAKYLGETIIGFFEPDYFAIDGFGEPIFGSFLVDANGRYIVRDNDSGICRVADKFNIRNSNWEKAPKKRGRHSRSANKQRKRISELFVGLNDDLPF